MVFGRDLKSIPCFRDSALYGIYSGFATILIALMATSKPILAADVGLGMFCVVTTGSFVFCRHQREKSNSMISEIKDMSNKSSASENTMDEA